MEASNYNIFRKTPKNNYVGVNLLTGALLKFKNQQQFKQALSIIKKPDSFPNLETNLIEIKNNLIKGGFIVKNRNEENNRIRARELLAQYGSKGLSITIINTFDCNFRCVYCYERHRKIYMNNKCMERILKFIGNQVKYRSTSPLSIAWYGGEPLLNLEIIRKLNSRIRDICIKNNCEFNSVMTTNGYLLKGRIAQILIDEFHLQKIMVTLDGPKEIHDKRRPLANGKGTYETIMENLLTFLEKKSNNTILKIRVNLDEENLDYLDDFLKNFPQKLRDNVIFEFESTSMLSTVPKGHYDKMFTPDKHPERVTKILTLYNRYINVDKTTKQVPFVFKPTKRWGTYCGVENLDSFVIGPRCRIYKCAAMVDEKDSIGKIDKEGKLVIDESKLANWTEWNPTNDIICGKCKFRPICHGGCKSKKKSKFPFCTQIKWSYKVYLDWFVDTYLE
jgi:uncharacterized protein